MSWDKLCRPKEEGGIGFRDLHAHNLALLSKQGWRLVKNPSSLLGRLYKVRYFPNSDFWLAPIPSSPSASWKGIFEARDLLVNGTRWQFRDGSSVHAWEDPWLPRDRDFRPLSRRSMRLSMVSEFITASKQWDSQLLEEHFEPTDVSLILSIPLLRHRMAHDKLICILILKAGLLQGQLVF
ncbi:hypothetical protein ACLB2K_024023 [Fragaria x ananassa]